MALLKVAVTIMVSQTVVLLPFDEGRVVHYSPGVFKQVIINRQAQQDLELAGCFGYMARLLPGEIGNRYWLKIDGSWWGPFCVVDCASGANTSGHKWASDRARNVNLGIIAEIDHKSAMMLCGGNCGQARIAREVDMERDEMYWKIADAVEAVRADPHGTEPLSITLYWLSISYGQAFDDALHVMLGKGEERMRQHGEWPHRPKGETS